MKKIIALVLVLAMMLPSAFAMTAGTYEAAAKGFHGDVKVSVTVDADKIVDIVVEHTETDGIGSVALPKLVEDVLKYQTINVDVDKHTGLKDWCFGKYPRMNQL